MEDLRQLLKEGKFLRIDAQGEHVESFKEFVKNDAIDMLKMLSRDPEDLLTLYEKNGNKKLVNDIALASLFKYMNEQFNVFISEHVEMENELDMTKEALKNAENMIKTLNTSKERVVETAAVKTSSATGRRRMGDELVSGINIGI